MTRPLKERVLRGAAVVVVLQVATQLTGLLSQTLIAARFGASAVTDAYVLAIAVVSLVAVPISLPVRQVLVPMFRHDLTRLGEETAWRNASVLLNNLVPLFVGVTLLAWIAAPWLVGAIGAGFDDTTTALAVSLTRILLLTVGAAGVTTFLAALYYSYHRFFVPEICGSLSNLATVAGLVLLGPTLGIHGVAIGVIAGSALMVALHLGILREHRSFYVRKIDFAHPGMTEMRRLSLPVFVGAGSIQTERIVDRLFASFLAAGSLSALAYARLLSRVTETFFLDPFQKTMHPHFTSLIAAESFGALSHQLFRYVRFVLFLTVPAAAGTVLLGDVMVGAVFQRGAFDHSAAALTSSALVLYAIGLPAAFVGTVLNQTFLGLKDTRTPMRLGLLRIGTKIALASLLLPFLAHAAIALAESLSHWVRLVGLVARLPQHAKAGQFQATLRSVAGTVALTALMAVVVLAGREATEGLPAISRLAILVSLGAGTYFGAGWLSSQSEAEWIGRSVRTLVAERRLAALS